MFTRRLHVPEFVSQAWFVTTTFFAPALLVAIPLYMVIVFQVIHILLGGAE